jgi:membrane protein
MGQLNHSVESASAEEPARRGGVRRAWLTARRGFGILKRAAEIWAASHAFVYAAALAFFTLFSVAPVAIVAVAIAGVALGEEAARGELFMQLEGVMGPEAAGVIETAVLNTRFEVAGIWPTLVGVGAMIIGATTVFAYLQKSLNAIWDVAARPSRHTMLEFLRNRVLSLAIVLALGFILMVSLLVGVATQAALTFAEQQIPVPGFLLAGTEFTVSFAIITLLFGAIFRILPDVVLDWNEVILGAAITALLFTLGRMLIAIYLAKTATASTYGAAGSLVLLLLWVNYSSLILLFGASFIRAQHEARGKPVVPRKGAVVVHHEVIEESVRPG